MKNFLETERLFIRMETAEEYKELFETCSDSELKDIFGMTDKALEVQKAKVKGGMTTYRTSFRMFHLIEKESKQIIGDFAFHNWYAIHSRAEVGYAMKADEYKNKGYLKEALKVIIPYGFDEMKLNRMEAIIGLDNIASQKAVTGIGFTYEALLKEHYCDNGIIEDSMLFRLLRSEFEQHKTSAV